MKLFEKGEIKLLGLFYINCFLSAVLYFWPIFYVVYFQDLNLSLFQIGVLLSANALASLIFEIPTGAIADLYGRKFSVLLGLFLSGFFYLLLFFSKDYYTILILFVLIGFSHTFYSGADEAWITDLIKKKKSKLLHDYFIKERSFYALGHIVGGFVGVIVVKYLGLSVIWIAAALAFWINFVIFVFIKEEYKRKESKISEAVKKLAKQTKDSLKYSLRHSVLFYFLLAGLIFVIAANFNAEISFIPLLKEFNFPNYALGYVWSAIGVIMMISPVFSKIFLKKDKEKKFLIISNTLITISLFLIIFASNIIIAFLVIFLFSFFSHMKIPVERIYFQKFIPTKLRATICSLESLILSAGSIIAIPIVGFLVEKIGPKNTIFISCFIMIPVIFLYIKIKEKTNKISSQ